MERVKTVNGGLSIEHGHREWQPHRYQRLVLSLQAKCKRSRRQGETNLTANQSWEDAGQIFRTMLGQVCHQEFYKNKTSDYQEVHQYPYHWLT
jgi:hypothetical protein